MSSIPVIRVRNAQRKTRVDIKRLQEFSSRALRLCLDLPKAASGAVRELSELNVVLVSDRRIAGLHKRFMGIAGATDVLTFQHGEIVVSVETAQRNALRFASSTEEEIRLYIIHGLLHLVGFDDKTAEQARTMEATQSRVLAALRNSSR